MICWKYGFVFHISYRISSIDSTNYTFRFGMIGTTFTLLLEPYFGNSAILLATLEPNCYQTIQSLFLVGCWSPPTGVLLSSPLLQFKCKTLKFKIISFRTTLGAPHSSAVWVPGLEFSKRLQWLSDKSTQFKDVVYVQVHLPRIE